MSTMVQLRNYDDENSAQKVVEGLSKARNGLEIAMVSLDRLLGCETLLNEVEEARENVLKMQADMHKIRLAHVYKTGY